MSLAALTWAKRQTAGGVAAKAVLMALADYADERGTCWPSQELIARETELTDRSVRDQLSKLEVAGLIARENRRRRDGTQASDRFILPLDSRNDIPAVRKDVPEEARSAGPEGRSGSATDSRNDVPQPPEGRSALTSFEPPQPEPLPPSQPDGCSGRAGSPQERALALAAGEALAARGALPKAKPPAERTPASRRMPGAWTPTARDLAVAAELSFNPGQVERELATMRDHQFRDAHSDWSAVFRNWLRREAKNSPNKPRLIHDRAAPHPDRRATAYRERLQDVGHAADAAAEQWYAERSG